MGAVTYGPSVIWRFEVEIADQATMLDLPATAKPLHAGVDKRTPARHVSLWCLVPVDSDGKPVGSTDRAFRVFGTGHPIPAKLEHVASILDNDRGGWFVWHVFELSENAAREVAALDRMRAKVTGER